MPIEPSDPTDVNAARSRAVVAFWNLWYAVLTYPKLAFTIAIAIGGVVLAGGAWAAGYIGAHTPTVTSTQITVTETAPADTGAP